MNVAAIKKQYPSLPRILSWSVLGIFVTLGLVTFLVHSLRDQVQATDNALISNLTFVASTRLEANLRRVDATLETLSHDYRRLAASREINGIERQILKERLQSLAKRFPEIAQINIVDGNGNQVETNNDYGLINLSQRDWFQQAKSNPNSPRFYADVVTGMQTKRAILPVVTPVTNGRGRFIGAIAVAIDLGFFGKVFGAIDFGEDTIFVLRRSDNGRLVLRIPARPDMVNHVPDTPISDAVLRQQDRGVFNFTSKVDGLDRIWSFSKVGDYPFIIVAGMTQTRSINAWKRVAYATYILAGLLSVVLLASIVTQARARQRREDLLLAVQAREAEYSELVRLSSDWHWEQDKTFRFSKFSDLPEELTPEQNPLGGPVLGKLRWEIPYCRPLIGEWSDHMQVLAEHRPFRNFHFIQNIPGKPVQYFRTSGNPIFSETGEFLGYRGTSANVTESWLARLELEHISRALQVLSFCNEAVLRADDEQRLLESICRVAVEVGGYKFAWVAYGADDEAKSIIPVSSFGDGNGYLDEIGVSWSEDSPVGNGPAGLAYRTREPVVFADISTDKRFQPWSAAARARGFRGGLTLPLVNDDAAFGVIVLFSAEVLHTPAAEVELMMRLADNLAFGVLTLRQRLERSRAQEEIRHLNADLEQRVILRTFELNRAMREMEEFTYMASHDLRSPLGVINGYAQLLQRGLGAQMPEFARRYLHAIERNALKMGELIDGFLTLSGISKRALQSVPIDVNRMVAEIVSAQQTREGARHAFVVHPLHAMHGDPRLILQVWTNLLSNAVKYSATTATPRVEVGCIDDEDALAYYVRDNGVGFDGTRAQNLFEPFQRLHSEKDFTGRGVGLSIVKRVIERHQGRVWAESVVGEGACFYFSVPKAFAA